MKSIILPLSLLLSSCVAMTQSPDKTTLRLYIEDSRDTEISPWLYSFDTVRVYKNTADTVVLTLVARNINSWPVLVENMTTGDYRVVYKNYYNQQLTDSITLDAKALNTVRIYKDKLAAYPQNTLNTFVNGDSLVIRFSSIGCFDWEYRKLVILKDQDRLIARIYYPSVYYVKKKKKNIAQYNDGKMLAETVLTQEKMQHFMRFENVLNNIWWGGCTTTDTYLLSGKLNLEKQDGSCKWRGFRYLEKALFKELLE